MKRYFELRKSTLGAGGTTQVENIEIHYYAKQVEDYMQLYLASSQGNPTEVEIDKVSLKDFEKRFKDCNNHSCPFGRD